MNDKINNMLFDREGNPVELEDVQRVSLICFKCTKYIKDKFATLISPEEEFFSDNVYKNETIHLCTDCHKEVMRFCGSDE